MLKDHSTRDEKQIEIRMVQQKLNKIMKFVKIPLRNVLLVTLRNEVK